MELKKAVNFLNKELKISKIKDSSRNGLQVYCGKKEIVKVGAAVDACLTTFKNAKAKNVDLLIVHHGLIWKGPKYPEVTKKRTDYLKKNKISLYAAHLPLDLHPKYGNNIRLLGILGLKRAKKFGGYHGVTIGYSGTFEKPKSMEEISEILDKKLQTKSLIYRFGKSEKIKSMCIVSGGGSSAIEEAVRKKMDCFLTGEMNLSAHNRAKDLGLNVIVSGHYATETVGVKALGELLREKFGISVVFVENKVEL